MLRCVLGRESLNCEPADHAAGARMDMVHGPAARRDRR